MTIENVVAVIFIDDGVIIITKQRVCFCCWSNGTHPNIGTDRRLQVLTSGKYITLKEDVLAILNVSVLVEDLFG